VTDEGNMQRHGSVIITIAIAAAMSSCKHEDDRDDVVTDTSDTVGPPIGTTAITTTNAITGTTLDASGTTSSTTGPDTAGGTADTTAATLGTTDDGQTEDPPFGALPWEEPFDGPDGAPWPAPWMEAGTAVLSARLAGGRGRLEGQTGRVARMVLPGFAETDVDATITVEFDDWAQQGFGLYVRQNGGALQETVPHGQGYVAYVEGGFMQSLGIWRETDGVEELLSATAVPGSSLAAGVPYRLRLECQQQGPHTRLRTRLWPEDEPEPAQWHLDIVDDTPVLQATPGSFAVDLFNYVGTGGVLVDDLRLEPVAD
jgi:hypothetical protein